MRPTLTDRLTVESLAPVIDGTPRLAPQPLGTWMSRWACLYAAPLADAPVAVTVLRRTLPQHLGANAA